MNTSSKPLKWYRELAGSKGRREAGAFLVEGDRAIRQVIGQHPEAITEILAAIEPPPLYAPFPVRRLTEAQFQYISGTRTPQGLAAVVKIPADVYSDSLPTPAGKKILLLEDIQDPGNAGTLVRTAAAFDFSGVIFSGNGADPFSPKCVQASAGALLSLWLRRTGDYPDLAKRLRETGYSLVTAELEGDSPPEVLPDTGDLVLALGNEAAGISPQLSALADYRARVPVAREKAESLNVAACGAILMYLSTR